MATTLHDNIRELACFVRVCEEASFSAAARSLDVDPSTVSKIIQRLENRLGVRLFHRTSRVLQQTQEGERFLAAVQKVLQALDDAEAALSPAATEVGGVLRVNCTPAFARFWLAPLMPTFVDGHPKLRVEFVLSAAPLDVFEQQIDISFQSGDIPDSSLVVRRLATVHWRIYGAPSYLARAGTPRVPADLEAHQCLNFLPGSYRSQWPLREGPALRSAAPVGQVAANDGDVLCALALAGLGLARLTENRVADDVRSGRLVSVLDAYRPDGDPLYAVYPSRRHLSPRVRAFVDHVAACLAVDGSG